MYTPAQIEKAARILCEKWYFAWEREQTIEFCLGCITGRFAAFEWERKDIESALQEASEEPAHTSTQIKPETE